MADVFLSYKREDQARASAVVKALVESGKTVWWDQGLTPHRAWDAPTDRALSTGSCRSYLTE